MSALLVARPQTAPLSSVDNVCQTPFVRMSSGGDADMSGGLQVVPAELHVSASLVDGHAGAVQAGHGAADSELAAAQAALAGSGGPTPPVRTPSLPCRA